MRFETKYYVGDKVYKISNSVQQVTEMCGFCEGRKRIVGSNGEKKLCPDCLGWGYHTRSHDLGWHVLDKPMTVGFVRIDYRGKSNGIKHGTITFDNYGPQTERYKEEYMCAETGIGSGSIYDVKILFPTKESAQEECDKLNAELKTVKE